MNNLLQMNDMKRIIAEKNVVIIGGHINFVNKLNLEFPNWTYIDANVVRPSDIKLVENADAVYFFSKYISHTVYNKFVKILRNKHIPFGYIHMVNIESLTHQVYDDFAKKYTEKNCLMK